ncbi:hypothetical protein AB0N05_10000 [Nocardia sp. NPDC051030]|uniref:hypothetical protein n=1 Tax=Nocardia sp. NPDC051030 TaxID=3155162 RepID=UPI003413EDCA
MNTASRSDSMRGGGRVTGGRTAIVSAAVCTDTDTASYFELATRAGRKCLEQAGVSPDQIGLVINAGVFRDNNIAEPAVAALLQKRLEIGLEYQTGRVPAFSFDLLNGATGVVHALMAAQSFTSLGDLEYALVLAGDTHPSLRRDVEDFPYSATGAALLVSASAAAGGFGRLYTSAARDTVTADAWADLEAAGLEGRSAVTVRTGHGDPLAASEAVVRACLAGEHLDSRDFAIGDAIVLAPAPVPGFRERLAYRLGVPSTAIAGVDPAVGDPYTAAPVHAYVGAGELGLLENARTVIFLAADDSSAACLAYRPYPLSATSSTRDGQFKYSDV